MVKLVGLESARVVIFRVVVDFVVMDVMCG